MDNTLLLLLLLTLSRKNETLQETLQTALTFYRENREAIQLLAQTVNSKPPTAQDSHERDNFDTKQPKSAKQEELTVDTDVNQTILEKFLKAQTL